MGRRCRMGRGEVEGGFELGEEGVEIFFSFFLFSSIFFSVLGLGGVFWMMGRSFQVVC